MRTLTATELLGAWEQGLSQPPALRALTLLALAGGGASPEELALLPIGWRDAQLLKLRESNFGSRINGFATCPACGQQLEMNFTVADVLVALPAEIPGAVALNLNDYQVCFRLPTSRDLTDLPEDGDEAALKRALLERCVLELKRDGLPISSEQLPAQVAEAISERMAETDPQADLRLALVCPQCAHGWRAPLDIVSFLWSEIHAWSVRILREAHVLASTYGWREADILAMTPWRRQSYLELIGS
jgi:hypothetical protein